MDENKNPAGEDTLITEAALKTLQEENESLKKTLGQAEHTIVELKKSSKSDSTDSNLLAQKIEELNKAQDERFNEFKNTVLEELINSKKTAEELQVTLASYKAQGGNPSTTKVDTQTTTNGVNQEKLSNIRKQFGLK